MKQMQDAIKSIQWLTWAARGLSVLVTIILLIFFIGESSSLLDISGRDAIMLLFFPVGLLVGMIWGWVKPVVGGAIGVASIVAFYIADLLLSGNLPSGIWFLVFGLPSYLFLAAGMLERGEKE